MFAFLQHIFLNFNYKELCKAAGQYDPKTKKIPLHKCDFYQSKEVGARLSAGLSLGASIHWKDVLEVMTGKRDLDATAILEYFDPLFKYLQEQNRMSEEELEEFLKEYEIVASKSLNEQVTAEWNYITDVNNKTKEEEQLNVTLKAAAFNKRYWNEYYDELTYVWKAWRDATGAKMKKKYEIYVDLSNEAAKANGFLDNRDMWRNDYESPTFIQDMYTIWEKVEPLYSELHRFVLNKLKDLYKDKLDVADGLIPAHVLESNSVCYNTTFGAVIEKPSDRKLLCHGSAWDFSDKKDFRIKMCTEVTYEYFHTVHHEMGHVQYFILYKNQPITFRPAANPGFHEAVGDTVALADSNKAALNSLMDMALKKVAFLPYALIVDKWRWDVFAGKIPKDNWNSHWWLYRKTFQKIKPPLERSEEYDFDPGAIFHVPGDAQYINYFVAHILQFQLYRGLCIAAGEYNPEYTDSPLHKCDFYESKSAGDRLRKGLSLGASKHWKDALEAITGERSLDASALLEYFQPLLEYLRKQNSGKIKSNAVSVRSSKAVVCTSNE